MIPKAILTIFVAAAIGGSAAAAADKFVVVVNGSNPATTMTKKELSRLFLKQVLVWGHGAKAIPIDLDARAPVRAQFSLDVLGRPVAAVQGYWNLKVFSGAVVPPDQRPSESQVIQFVASNPGAVGYVSPTAALQGVKVLQVVD
jgi:ABC-type phosphate transport system substrate-binding protein